MRLAATTLALCALAGAAAAEDTSDAPAADALVEQARRLQLHETRDWLRLVHYREGWFGGWESEVDAPHFFLAPDGKSNPAAELEATIRALLEPSIEETDPPPPAESETQDDRRARMRASALGQSPRCRFPARAAWLDARLGADAFPKYPCPRFEAWSGSIRARSVTLVFASAYLNNPASMFGHTFLRLDRAEGPGATALTSYAANFSATPTTSNGVLYAILGLTGGFDGTYSTLPYYLKVKEYGDLERRDMWEYRLGFTPAETDQLVRHLWEVGPTWAEYYYADENCSYQILTVLEAAAPRLHLLPMRLPWIVPVDTLKTAIDAPGLVVDRTFRPSRYLTLHAHRDRLDGDEAALAEDLADGGSTDPIAALDVHRAAAVLDAALELMRYRDPGNRAPTEAHRATEHRLLSARGQLRVRSEPVTVEPGPAPETGHGSAMIALGGGYGDAGGFGELELRPSLHTLRDIESGFAPGSEITFLGTRLRVDGDRSGRAIPWLERLDVIRIASLAPIHSWTPAPSWRVSGSVARTRDDGPDDRGRLFAQLAGGPGIAVGGRALAYGFLDVDIGFGSQAFDDGYRIGAGASAGLAWSIWDPLRLHVEGGWLYPFLGVPRPELSPVPEDGAPWRGEGGLTLRLTRDAALRLQGSTSRGYRELGLSLATYL